MFKKLTRLLFGDPNQKELDRLQPIVEEITALEKEMQALSDADLRASTDAIRDRLQSAMAEANSKVEQLEKELDAEPDEDQRRVIARELEEAKDERDRDEREILDDELPRAFAVVREASIRTISMRHYDEQMIGGLVLHRNTIAEMKTGEGKTLVATLPLYLNALPGRGAHLITPNDYLSKVGVQWMGPVYTLLGLSVAVIQSMGRDPSMSSFIYDPDYVSADDRYQHLRPVSRAEAYQADITYGTNNEFGFDYLRDNMVRDASQCVQRELYYAIVDEVDNILIDEARTPLIISGQANEATQEYSQFAEMVRHLQDDDYEQDEKARLVTITEQGIEKVEKMLGLPEGKSLYDAEYFHLTPYLENALKARILFDKDRHYVVRDGEVIIVDEHTGRLMYGRRYSEGLHQAIEAKEGVKIQNESLTMATVTFQNFFRMYRRLAGMTGTAVTESEEFSMIYDLEVTVIPTHRPLARLDHPDVVYKTIGAKYDAVFNEIAECHAKGQPVLVGTLAIETSEMISRQLKRMRIPNQVLNAKQHEREAVIIAQAGRSGAVTIATNMAGRGVDILLGGNPEGMAREALRKKRLDLQELEPGVWEAALAEAETDCAEDRERVLAAGGLHVLGTERYEARRIDNQLRGRAGRQGDVGSSRFYVALEDDLMRLFGGPKVANLMDRLGVDEDIPIEANMVSSAIANAQIRVEGHNFDMRKHLLEYDDVANEQRQVIYQQRRLILVEPEHAADDQTEDKECYLKPVVMDIFADHIQAMVDIHTASDLDEWDLETLHTEARRDLNNPREALKDRELSEYLPEGRTLNDFDPEVWDTWQPDEIVDYLTSLADAVYDYKAEVFSPENLPTELKEHSWLSIQRSVMLSIIDQHWVRHLTALDELREGIGLRAVGQRNPLVEYKREAYEAFQMLLDVIETQVANSLFNVGIRRRAQTPRTRMPRRLNYSGAGQTPGASNKQETIRAGKKVGRNDPCPCGSGKKYKSCCMREGLSPEEAAAKGAKQAAG